MEIIFDREEDRKKSYLVAIDSMMKEHDRLLKTGFLYDYDDGVFLYYNRVTKKLDIKKDWYDEDFKNPNYIIIEGGTYQKINYIYQKLRKVFDAIEK